MTNEEIAEMLGWTLPIDHYWQGEVFIEGVRHGIELLSNDINRTIKEWDSEKEVEWILVEIIQLKLKKYDRSSDDRV